MCGTYAVRQIISMNVEKIPFMKIKHYNSMCFLNLVVWSSVVNLYTYIYINNFV